jgi:HK97 family phage prohead protease
MPDVVFLLNHEGMSLARTKPQTLKLVEDGIGLHSEAKLDPINPHVIALRSAVERGDIDEMSFAFRVMSQTWDESYEDRTINEVNIHHGDVSAVNFGANPYTAGTVDLRGRKDHMEMNSARFLASLDDLIARSALDEDALLAIDERFGALRALATAEQDIDEPPAAGRTVADARRRLSVALAAA